MVVNKADREGAERTVQQLKGALSLRAHDRHKVPVLKTTATTGDGVDALAEAIGEIAAAVCAEGPEQRRRRRARYLIARAAADLVAQRVREGGGAQARSAGRRRARRHAAARGRGAPAAVDGRLRLGRARRPAAACR